MPYLMRPPISPRLRPFVQTLWAMAPYALPKPHPSGREHVLPTGAMHLVFRLSGPPLRIFAGDGDEQGNTVGHAIVSGARASFYARDVSQPTASVGALLHPGAALPLFGAPEGPLAARHTPLDALWGLQANLALERLQAAGSLLQQLDLFEALLIERLGDCFHGLHPAVAQALAPLMRGALPVAEVAARSGLSHRRFIDRFRGATGLAPKAYASLHRLNRVLAMAAAQPQLDWAQIAFETGYSDQAHLTHAFTGFAGLSPQAWRLARPASPRHVPR